MSLENHPNFHALKFTAAIMSSYYECLRGAAEKNAPSIKDDVALFVRRIEEKVDRRVNGRTIAPREQPHETQ